jgi:hypothetical protein
MTKAEQLSLHSLACSREAVAKAKKALPTSSALPHYPGLWGSQVSVSSPTSLSPSSSATFQEGHVCVPLFRFSLSPLPDEYPNNNPHDGFIPNSFVPSDNPQRGGFNADLNVTYGVSAAHRRVPLHFDNQGCASLIRLQRIYNF